MKRLFKIFAMVAALAAFAWGAYLLSISLLPKWNETIKLTEQRDALESQVSELKAEVEGFKTKQSRFATDAAFVERVARQHGRSTPNEIVFVFE